MNDKKQNKELSKIDKIISTEFPTTYLIIDKHWDINKYFGCYACSSDDSKHNDAFRKSVDILL